MKKLLLLFILLGLALFAASCGGGMGSVTSKARVTVEGWGASGALPADHVEVELWELDYLVETADPPLSATSPEVTFGGLLALRYRVVAKAYDAGGSLLATAAFEVPVTVGETAEVVVSLAQGPSDRLELTPNPLWVETGADAPWHVAAFDAAGRVLLLEGDRFDAGVSPSELASVAENSVHGLVEGRGELVVSDNASAASASCELLVDNPATWFLKQTWGGQGSGYGEFLRLGGVATGPCGEIYATDRWGDSVTQFDSDGDVLDVFGSWGSGEGEFDVPWDVEVDWEGNVYVSDRDNGRIQIFDDWSTWLRFVGEEGAGSLIEPTGLAVDDYALWVADWDEFGFFEGQLVQYDADDFSYQDTWDVSLPGGCEAWDVISDGWDTTYVTAGDKLIVLNSFGYEEDSWGVGVLSGAEGLALDGDDNLFIADPDAGLVVVYSSEGGLLAQLSIEARDVAITREGDLIAACADNYLRRYTRLPAP